MSIMSNLPTDLVIEKDDTKALIELYNQVPVATIPRDWLCEAGQFVTEMDKVVRLAKQNMLSLIHI